MLSEPSHSPVGTVDHTRRSRVNNTWNCLLIWVDSRRLTFGCMSGVATIDLLGAMEEWGVEGIIDR
jgi:hypothetical protein